ncbi:MAG: 2Fe-2S iron-sulfur cluster-binding protein, partial [Thermoplasmata archaeon]
MTSERERIRRLPILQRSIRYHRPRAPFCGVGYCTNCLVRTDQRLNVRACREGFLTTGVHATSHAWPSPRHDLWGILDLLFPRGIDTLRGFCRPSWAVPAYQRVVRRLAGYDSPQSVTLPPSPGPPRVRSADVLIIGNGTSGTAAADELRARGIESIVVIDRSRAPENGTVLGRTTAVFRPPPTPRAPHPFRALASEGFERGALVSARKVIVATGGYDATLLFPGNDRPGVMTADGAFSFESSGLEPFRHAVVFGGGDRARGVVEKFGDRVVAVVAPGEIGPDLTRVASDLHIPLYPRCLV